MSTVLYVTLLQLAYIYNIHVAIEHLKVRIVFANLGTTCNINIKFHALWKVHFSKKQFYHVFYFLIIKIKWKTNMLRGIECIKVIQIMELEPFLDNITTLHPEFIWYESNLFTVQNMHNCYLIVQTYLSLNMLIKWNGWRLLFIELLEWNRMSREPWPFSATWTLLQKRCMIHIKIRLKIAMFYDDK